MRLSRRRGQVTHVLLTRSPLIQNQQKPVPSPFDLHVLSTPPAFVLSQDQTLQTKPTKFKPQPTTNTVSQNPKSVQQSRKPDQAQPNPTTKRARQTKTKQPQKPHTTKNHAQPPGPWHKKHDTLSSSQTTHPPRFQLGKNSLLASRRRPDYHKQVVVRESNSDRVTLISELFCFFRAGEDHSFRLGVSAVRCRRRTVRLRRQRGVL